MNATQVSIILAAAACVFGIAVFISVPGETWAEKMRREACHVVYIEPPSSSLTMMNGQLRAELIPGRTVYLCNGERSYVR